MAVFNGVIKSQKLQMDTNLVIILPHDSGEKESYKILYLLHGLSDNAFAWTRFTCIEDYARQKGYIVIMPEVQRSFYTDMAYGMAYFSYITAELPEICHKMFGIKPDREKTFIAGLSMGGYGALKCGLRCMEQYAGVASFSGACDMKKRIKEMNQQEDRMRMKEMIAIVGEDGKLKEQDDLFAIAKNNAGTIKDQMPKILITCGLDDFLYEDNKSFKSHLELLGYEPKYLEWEGDHTWSFWNTSVEIAMDFFDHIPKKS